MEATIQKRVIMEFDYRTYAIKAFEKCEQISQPNEDFKNPAAPLTQLGSQLHCGHVFNNWFVLSRPCCGSIRLTLP